MIFARTRLALVVLALAILSPLVASAQSSTSSASGQSPLLLRNPSLSQDKIAFLYADDVWTVSRQGGEAERLTSNGKVAAGPFFSPDGSEIAYSAHLNGNTDVYVIPAGGGVPRRITWHPAGSAVVGWTPDGKNVLIASGAISYRHFLKLFVGACRRLRHARAAAPAHRRAGLLFARRPVDRLSAGHQVGAGLEALRRRPDYADLDRQPQDARPGEGAARELQRLQPGLGRECGLLPLRPQRRPSRSSGTTWARNRSARLSRTRATT